MMNKFLPEYLEDICKAGAASAEALKEVCKKLDLILDAIYGEEETAVSADTNEDLVVPVITLPEILPAKQVKLPNEDNEEVKPEQNVKRGRPRKNNK